MGEPLVVLSNITIERGCWEMRGFKSNDSPNPALQLYVAVEPFSDTSMPTKNRLPIVGCVHFSLLSSIWVQAARDG